MQRLITFDKEDKMVLTTLALDWYKGTALASEKRCILAKEIDFKDIHEEQTELAGTYESTSRLHNGRTSADLVRP